MTTGWKWIRDDGEETKSQLGALALLREKPDSRIFFSELSMAGEKRTDVTEQLLAVLQNRLSNKDADT